MAPAFWHLNVTRMSPARRSAVLEYLASVTVASLSGETTSASVRGRFPRWMSMVKWVASDRNVTRLPKKPGSVSDARMKFDTGPLNSSSDSVASSYGCGGGPTGVAAVPPPANISVPGTNPVMVYAGR